MTSKTILTRTTRNTILVRLLQTYYSEAKRSIIIDRKKHSVDNPKPYKPYKLYKLYNIYNCYSANGSYRMPLEAVPNSVVQMDRKAGRTPGNREINASIITSIVASASLEPRLQARPIANDVNKSKSRTIDLNIGLDLGLELAYTKEPTKAFVEVIIYELFNNRLIVKTQTILLYNNRIPTASSS